MFCMTNTRHKFIIIDLNCNIHTVILIYIINLANTCHLKKINEIEIIFSI